MVKAGWIQRLLALNRIEKCVQTVTEAVADVEPGDVIEIGDFLRDERGKRVVIKKIPGYHTPSGRKDDPLCMLYYR